MQKGILFLAILAAVAISFVLLLNLGARADSYSFWLVLFLLPTAGFIAGRVNFKTDD